LTRAGVPAGRSRTVHVLTAENNNLRKDLDKRRSSAVTTLPSRR
jgi:DNA-binding winged helix-turn-helix (wHTH) protein